MMASVFRIKGRKTYRIEYTDEHGERQRTMGTTDKGVSERIGRELENRAALRRDGVIDERDEKSREARGKSIAEHLGGFREFTAAKGATAKHVDLFVTRATRVVALVMGAKLADIEPAKNATRAQIAKAAEGLAKAVKPARLPDLTVENVQSALATLVAEGRSLQTVNHHRTAIRAFSTWCHTSQRTRDDVLRGVTGYNVKEDPRHERRTIGLEEQVRLIEATESNGSVMGVSAPVRALCYRLAISTGLRFSEIATITPESFDFRSDISAVKVAAAYTKNGEPAELALPADVADDLRLYVAQNPPGTTLFPLPEEKGAKMLRADLEAAGIAYRDLGGLVFDFHALRCQMATNADAAGVSPRVVQKMMRHSTLELTGKYTRPRAVDVGNASATLPSLKPPARSRDSARMNGTDSMSVSMRDTAQNTDREEDDRHNSLRYKVITSVERRSHNPQVSGSNPDPGICIGKRHVPPNPLEWGIRQRNRSTDSVRRLRLSDALPDKPSDLARSNAPSRYRKHLRDGIGSAVDLSVTANAIL